MINLIYQLGNLILTFTRVYRIVLLIYFLMSWIPGSYQSGFGQFLVKICEPYVGVFRQIIPPIGMISLAGLAAYLFTFLFDLGIVAIMEFLIQVLAVAVPVIL